MGLTRTGQPTRTSTLGWTRGLIAILAAAALSACVGDAIMGTEDARIRPDQRPLALPPPVHPSVSADRDPNAFPPVYDPLVVPDAPSAAPHVGSASSAPAPPSAAPLGPVRSAELAAPPQAPAPAAPEIEVVNPPTPVAATPVTPPSQTGIASGFWVQAGAFAVPANAERLAERLSAFGRVDVDEIFSAGRPLLRVRLGPYASRAEANAALAQVRGAGYPEAVIVR